MCKYLAIYSCQHVNFYTNQIFIALSVGTGLKHHCQFKLAFLGKLFIYDQNILHYVNWL